MELETGRRHRLTDKQALAVLAAYFGLRIVTVRASLAFLPWLLRHAPWSIPLLRNTLLTVIAAAAAAAPDLVLLTAIGSGSLLIASIGGLLLYWAGYRFGPELAKRAEREGSVWASFWNPRQVARAHRWLERRGVFAVGLSRALGWLVTPVALVAGSSLMSFRKYVLAHSVGAVAWSSTAVWLGVRARTEWPWLPERIESFSNLSWKVGLVLLAVLVIALLASGRARAGDEAAGAPEAEPGAAVEPEGRPRDRGATQT